MYRQHEVNKFSASFFFRPNVHAWTLLTPYPRLGVFTLETDNSNIISEFRQLSHSSQTDFLCDLNCMTDFMSILMGSLSAKTEEIEVPGYPTNKAAQMHKRVSVKASAVWPFLHLGLFLWVFVDASC